MHAEPESEQLRVPYVAAGRVLWEGGEEEAIVCDLSSRGLHLQLGRVPPREVEVRFPLPDGGPPVMARVAVRWFRRGVEEHAASRPLTGCGMSFVGLAASDRERIDRIVADYRSRPTPDVGVTQPRSGLSRIPLIAPCTLAGEFGELHGRTCNLSVFGVYAALASPPQRGEVAELRVELPPPVGSFVRRVTVAWRNPATTHRPHILPEGCGLRFEGLATLDVRHLSRLVDERLERLLRLHS